MIRPMQPADKQPVLALVRATGMFTPAEVDVAEELIDIYLGVPEQPDYRVVVVENERKEVVGYLTWGPTPMAVDVYDLYWMAVAPSEQGRGRGRELVRWLEAEVGQRRGRMIIIETSSQPRYHPTRQFYINLGYREVARIPDYYKPGDDRVIYAKSIR
ncbi:MAG TPA: GNAT family N-acetyltransferase [Terriglobales bacterium]|nr:GNAT family N-acetyltransferase [Terriglobales bacterium]